MGPVEKAIRRAVHTGDNSPRRPSHGLFVSARYHRTESFLNSESSGRRTWFPNLRVLVSYGLIEKAGESSRGGRRAYYRFAAKESVKKALEHLGEGGQASRTQGTGRQLLFVAAGDSGERDSDFGRRSADLDYEPPTWR